jgi:multisubunit Na+/H+ antiporter MnhF subunit
MSVWMAASIVLVCALVGCGIACIGSPLAAGLAVLNIAGVIAVVLLVTLTEAFQRQPFMDLAEALAAASLAGGLAFVRFLDRRR